MNIRMSTKGKRPLRSLTPSDKIHAIQRIHDGESKASVARDIGVPESTLRGWCKNEDKLRLMCRQSIAEKMTADSLSEKLDGNVGLIGGPPEKRQKLDPAMPLNFSSKLKYVELAYKRPALNGIDFSGNKTVSDFNFNGLTPEYVAFNGAVKPKVFGADIPRQTDPSMTAISPLSSLSHLSGLTGLSQSPLAISFNELTSNLNLLAQLNPGLAAMSTLNSLSTSANTLRNVKIKPAPMNSPRSECGERPQGLSVKTWAKQKPTFLISSDSVEGLNLSQNDGKPKIKCPSPSLAPSLGGNLGQLPTLPEDPLLYWIKSQQAMLGLNNYYPPTTIDAASPPRRSSTPQQPSNHTGTPPITATPLTPSSTPSGSLDDKNSAWFNWCKAFGASLNSLAPVAAAAVMHGNPMQHPPSSTTTEASNMSNQKPAIDNILYSHLTKDTSNPSVHSFSSTENTPANEVTSNTDSTGKPEDLTAKSAITNSTVPSPLPTPAHSPPPSAPHSPLTSPDSNLVNRTDADTMTNYKNGCTSKMADCKDVLDNLLYKINNNPNTSLDNLPSPESNNGGCESEESYNSDGNQNINDLSHNNNNNNSNKTDEEEQMKHAERIECDDFDAIKHGEKFLKWLEKCSNPRITAVQLMQLRLLIAAVKSSNDPKNVINETTPNNLLVFAEETTLTGESLRNKSRRRK